MYAMTLHMDMCSTMFHTMLDQWKHVQNTSTFSYVKVTIDKSCLRISMKDKLSTRRTFVSWCATFLFSTKLFTLTVWGVAYCYICFTTTSVLLSLYLDYVHLQVRTQFAKPRLPLNHEFRATLLPMTQPVCLSLSVTNLNNTWPPPPWWHPASLMEHRRGNPLVNHHER